MKLKKKTIQIMFLITLLLLSSTVSNRVISKESIDSNMQTINDYETISDPLIEFTESHQTTISIPTIDTYLTIPDAPKIPIIRKTYTFPKGTQIQEITCTPLNTESINLEQPIEKTPAFQSISGNKFISNQDTTDISRIETYPETWYTTQTGAGITTSAERVIYLTITLHPIRYHPLENTITSASEFNIHINHLPPPSNMNKNKFETTHDLVIITPESYVSTLNPFVDHKKDYNLNPLIKTTTEIYDEFQGRDQQEKIKYFIKHAIETYNTKYVLLIGDITQLPIRQTDAYPWDPYHGEGILTDLYYADIYDSEGNFCSWDSNNNDIFGEVSFDRFPPTPDNIIDDVDLYPDVHIGRIPCTTIDELTIVLSKIITYERITAYQNWFQQIILAGGDTFAISKGSPLNVFEGEITNIKVGQQLPEFKQIRLWASERNLNAKTFNQAISNGAGFVSYAGHGFQHGWGTYRPNAILDWNLILYYTPFIKQLSNEHRLPIIFFDACLTAKFDFSIIDLQDYYGLKAPFIRFLLGFDKNDDFYPSFAWAFLKHENGGAIATIGATRPAYTFVDKDGVYAGAGLLDVRFFSAYEEGITVGEMLSQAQTDYLNFFGPDVFTIQEFLLLGDPSLRVGGYW